MKPFLCRIFSQFLLSSALCIRAHFLIRPFAVRDSISPSSSLPSKSKVAGRGLGVRPFNLDNLAFRPWTECDDPLSPLYNLNSNSRSPLLRHHSRDVDFQQHSLNGESGNDGGIWGRAELLTHSSRRLECTCNRGPKRLGGNSGEIILISF